MHTCTTCLWFKKQRYSTYLSIIRHCYSILHDMTFPHADRPLLTLSIRVNKTYSLRCEIYVEIKSDNFSRTDIMGCLNHIVLMDRNTVILFGMGRIDEVESDCAFDGGTGKGTCFLGPSCTYVRYLSLNSSSLRT